MRISLFTTIFIFNIVHMPFAYMQENNSSKTKQSQFRHAVLKPENQYAFISSISTIVILLGIAKYKCWGPFKPKIEVNPLLQGFNTFVCKKMGPCPHCSKGIPHPKFTPSTQREITPNPTEERIRKKREEKLKNTRDQRLQKLKDARDTI